jgi:hypothetical protein
MDLCFQAITTNDPNLIHHVTLLKLCTSHLTKNMKRDIFANFKKANAFFVAALMGGIFNLEAFEELDIYIKDFLTILLCRYKCNELSKSLQKFDTFAAADEWPKDDSNAESADPEFSEFETIYKHSRFFQRYDAFIRVFQVQSSFEEENPYYNPKFVAIIMKKYISFLPFWTLPISKMKNEHPSRANNGFVEGKILKTFKKLVHI